MPFFYYCSNFWLAEEHYEVNTSFHISGLYVSRNTYIRAAVAEWKVTNPVHLVYFYSLSYLCDYSLQFILFIKRFVPVEDANLFHVRYGRGISTIKKAKIPI
jgi:hypothetical protein